MPVPTATLLSCSHLSFPESLFHAGKGDIVTGQCGSRQAGQALFQVLRKLGLD